MGSRSLKKHFLALAAALFCLAAHASMEDEGEMELVKEHEAGIIAQVKKAKLPPAQVADLYNLAGREYFVSYKYKVAAHMYGQSIKHAPNWEAYEALARLSVHEAQGAAAMGWIDKARPLAPNQASKDLLDYLSAKAQGKDSASLYGPDRARALRASHSFGTDLMWHDARALLAQGQAQPEARELLASVDARNAAINLKVIVDAAAVFSGNPTRPLLCKDMYQAHPKARARTYTMALCGLLLEAAKGGKPKARDKEGFKLLLKEYPEESPLGAAVARYLGE